jgi:hypothetical protein
MLACGDPPALQRQAVSAGEGNLFIGKVVNPLGCGSAAGEEDKGAGWRARKRSIGRQEGGTGEYR